MDADVIVVGGGLAGLVATVELADRGRRVLLVEQEPEASLGGQAFWSLGGLFAVDTPEQRRLRICDSAELAWRDWLGTAGFDRAEEDRWGRRWARSYVDFAAGEQRSWLRALGVRFFPVVAWAERGGSLATGPGNSVPRFHLTWGTGPGLLTPFERRVRRAVDAGLVRLLFRHRVDELTVTGGAVDGVRGSVLEQSPVRRGAPSSRRAVADFELHAPAMLITSGGIGADHDLVRANWPDRLGPPPRRMVCGVPDHVDGRMLAIAERAGGLVVNRDRMWHYPEGVRAWDPVWTNHGIRILPGPSPLWLDACGRRLPVPRFPGFDTLGALEAIGASGFDHSWFVLSTTMLGKEIAFSGSEQNPDLTGKSVRTLLRRLLPGPVAPVETFRRRGTDIVVAHTLPDLVDRMNALTGGGPPIDHGELRSQIEARDLQVDNPFAKDLQLVAARGSRRYPGDRLLRVTRPHRLLDPRHGPLVAVRLHILSRKTLGGLQTDLSARVLRPDGTPLPGLYAAGEVAGFGGGGMHGYRSLEGTFLGGCLFSGRQAGRALASA